MILTSTKIGPFLDARIFLSTNFERDTPVSLVFEAGVPNDALGGESGIVTLTLTLDDDPQFMRRLHCPLKSLELRFSDGRAIRTEHQ